MNTLTIQTPIDYNDAGNRIESMVITGRDQEIIRTVARFNQITGQQLRRALFTTQQTLRGSIATSNRRLKGLVDAGYLKRLAYAQDGYTRGGVAFVYILPSNKSRIPRPHALDVAELYAALAEAGNGGRLRFGYFDPEPSCNLWIDGILLRPDAAVRVNECDYLFELDRATEGGSRIAEKVRRYQFAYSKEPATHHPRVVFIVPTEDRKRHLNRVLDHIAGASNIASVILKSEVVEWMVRQ